MPLHSMTAFARIERSTPHGTITCELKSVNHRHLECFVNLNDPLRPYEMTIREQLRAELSRGKIDCWMRFQIMPSRDAPLELHQPTLQQLEQLHYSISHAFPKNPISLSFTDLLNWPSLLKQPTIQDEEMKHAVESIIHDALEELKATRAREGLALHIVIQERLHQLQTELEVILQRSPLVLAQFKERLSHKLEEYRAQLQPDRLEQEFILLTHKMDIHEEIDRLRTHLAELERVCRAGGSVGRRCDFLLQEINREVNTIASKSQDSAIAHACVEMKVIIEQIREQVQNLE